MTTTTSTVLSGNRFHPLDRHKLPVTTAKLRDYLQILEIAPFFELMGCKIKMIELTDEMKNSSSNIYELVSTLTELEEKKEIISHRIVVTPPHTYLIVEYS